MKKNMVLLLAFVMIMALTACGNSEENNSGSDSKNDKITLKVGGQNNEEDPSTIALEKMAENVLEETDGRVEMDIFPANQLGDYVLMYEEISKGTVDMGLITAPTQMDKRLEMAMLPYLFQNYEEAREKLTTDSSYKENLEEIHNDQNVKLLGFHPDGFGGVGTVDEIKDPLNLEEEKDLLLRVSSIEVSKKNMEDLGFKTVTVPYSDVYTAMQTGTIDGWMGGSPLINYEQFRDVIEYYYHYKNFFEISQLLINNDVYDQLSDSEKEVIQKEADKLTDHGIEVSEENDKKYMQKMEEEGIEVIEFSDDEIQKLTEHSRENSYTDVEDDVGSELLDSLLEDFE